MGTRYIKTTNAARWFLFLTLRGLDKVKGQARRAVRRTQKSLELTDDELDEMDQRNEDRNKEILLRNVSSTKDEVELHTHNIRDILKESKEWDRQEFVVKILREDAERLIKLIDEDLNLNGVQIEQIGDLLDDLEDASKNTPDERFLRPEEVATLKAVSE